MAGQEPSPERVEVLADVAEVDFLQGLTQAQIARRVGVNRSIVSRMIGEARRQGIVEYHIRRPLQCAPELAEALMASFGLGEACVVIIRNGSRERGLRRLGQAGAQVPRQHLRPRLHLGLAWGTAVGATVQALEGAAPIPSIQVIRLIGALGARIVDDHGHALVRSLEAKLDGEGYYIHAPFRVDTRQTAQALLNNKCIAQTIALARQCDVALLGIGSIDPEHSSLYRAGYVPLREWKAVQRTGAVGDSCGLHFDARGRPCGGDFSARLMGVSERILQPIVALTLSADPRLLDGVLAAELLHEWVQAFESPEAPLSSPSWYEEEST